MVGERCPEYMISLKFFQQDSFYYRWPNRIKFKESTLISLLNEANESGTTKLFSFLFQLLEILNKLQL